MRRKGTRNTPADWRRSDQAGMLDEVMDPTDGQDARADLIPGLHRRTQLRATAGSAKWASKAPAAIARLENRLKASALPRL